MFGATDIYSNPKHWHHFACPAYTLVQEQQQAGGIFHKWKARSKVGIYLGRSPSHFRSVALILDINTGLVSPQFHIKLDPLFQTVKGPSKQESHNSLWQIKSGFFLQKDNEQSPARHIRKSGKHTARVSDRADERETIVTNDMNSIPEIVQQLILNVPMATREDMVNPWTEHNAHQRETEALQRETSTEDATTRTLGNEASAAPIASRRTGRRREEKVLRDATHRSDGRTDPCGHCTRHPR
jgi:hypothetical protein